MKQLLIYINRYPAKKGLFFTAILALAIQYYTNSSQYTVFSNGLTVLFFFQQFTRAFRRSIIEDETWHWQIFLAPIVLCTLVVAFGELARYIACLSLLLEMIMCERRSVVVAIGTRYTFTLMFIVAIMFDMRQWPEKRLKAIQRKKDEAEEQTKSSTFPSDSKT